MAPGETAEQAQRRRAEQAEKRRLAVERQAARDAAAASRKRKATGDATAVVGSNNKNNRSNAAGAPVPFPDAKRARSNSTANGGAAVGASSRSSSSLSSLDPSPSPAKRIRTTRTSGAPQAKQPVVTKAESTDNHTPVNVNRTLSSSIVGASPGAVMQTNNDNIIKSKQATVEPEGSHSKVAEANNDNIIKSKQAMVEPEGSHSKERLALRRSTRGPSQSTTTTTTTTVGTGVASITNTKKQDAPASTTNNLFSSNTLLQTNASTSRQEQAPATRIDPIPSSSLSFAPKQQQQTPQNPRPPMREVPRNSTAFVQPGPPGTTSQTNTESQPRQPTAKTATRTPPRRSVQRAARRASLQNKPPFGSPVITMPQPDATARPPQQTSSPLPKFPTLPNEPTFSEEATTSSTVLNPPTRLAARTQRASAEALHNTSSPLDPPTGLLAPTPRGRPGTPTSVSPSQDIPLPTATRGIEKPPASSGNTATPAPNQVLTSVNSIQSLERMYAELDRMDNDDDEEDGDYEDESEDEELRQAALQVIAERRHRERLHQARQEAAAYEQRCRAGQERVQKWRRKQFLFWGPMLVALTVAWLSMALAGYKPLLVSFPQLMRWIWQKQCELLWGESCSVSKQVTTVVTCFLDSESFSVNHSINLDYEQGHALTAMNPQCSEDGPDEKLQPDDEQMELNHIIEWVTCPVGAICHGGRLLACPTMFQIHDNNCYLSEESNSTLDAMQTLLHDWTIKHYCQMEGNSDANGTLELWTNRPFFHYSRVVGELECGYNLRLLHLGNLTTTSEHLENIPKKQKKIHGEDIPYARFVLEAYPGDPNIWLALHPDMPLEIPRSCYYGRLVFGFIFFAMAMISVALTALWDVVQYLVVFYLNALAASPWTVGLTSIFVVGLSSSVYRRCKERAQRQKRQEQVLFVRNQVHMRLQHQAAQAAALSDAGDEDIDDHKTAAAELSSNWLCQDLAWKLYQTSRRDRHILMTQIWPHVVRDVHEDKRIGKKVRVEEESEVSANGGGQRQRVVEYWTWLPPVSTLHTDSHVVAKTVAAQYQQQ